MVITISVLPFFSTYCQVYVTGHVTTQDANNIAKINISTWILYSDRYLFIGSPMISLKNIPQLVYHSHSSKMWRIFLLTWFVLSKEARLQLNKSQKITFKFDIESSRLEKTDAYLFRVIIHLENQAIIQ